MSFRSVLSATLSAALLCGAATVSVHAADAPAQAPAPKASAPQPYARLHADPSGSYTVDADHSGVQFSIGHVGVAACTGVFKKISGSYTFDAQHPQASKADITIDVGSLDTFMPMRDEHLLDAAFFDVKHYPQMHFVSTRYVPRGRKGGLLYGDLSLRGVTKPVVFKVRLVGAGEVSYLPKPWGGYLSGFVATTVIDRTDFGMDAYPSALSHKVRVRVEVEGVRNPA